MGKNGALQDISTQQQQKKPSLYIKNKKLLKRPKNCDKVKRDKFHNQYERNNE